MEKVPTTRIHVVLTKAQKRRLEKLQGILSKQRGESVSMNTVMREGMTLYAKQEGA